MSVVVCQCLCLYTYIYAKKDGTGQIEIETLLKYIGWLNPFGPFGTPFHTRGALPLHIIFLKGMRVAANDGVLFLAR